VPPVRSGCSLLLALVAVACAAPPEPPAPAGFPPSDERTLIGVLQPRVSPFELRMTRAALIDLEDQEYEESPMGRHLALYAEPAESPYPVSRYIDNMVPLLRSLALTVFARWPELASFDICQEPRPEVNDAETPIPLTRVQIDRQTADAIDWEEVDLADLLELHASALARDVQPGVRVVVFGEVRRDPEYRSALRQSDRQEPI
jgi:hypothetical protein